MAWQAPAVMVDFYEDARRWAAPDPIATGPEGALEEPRSSPRRTNLSEETGGEKGDGRPVPPEDKRAETAPRRERLDADVVVSSVLTVETASGLGTGFVVGRAGIILTNAHVINEARVGEEVVVRWGGVREKAVVREIARRLDLAVLECPEASQCATRSPLPLGEGAKTKLGATVFAFGNPAGLDLTMTKGIVSHRGRKFRGVVYMQTDLAVNPGNSGGPLLDERGRVIGVITAKLASAEGIAFALPIEYATSGWEAPLRSSLKKGQVSSRYSTALANLIRDAPDPERVEEGRARAHEGLPSRRSGSEGTKAITVTSAYAQSRLYALSFQMTVPRDVRLRSSKFQLLLANGSIVPLGKLEPTQFFEQEVPPVRKYMFEYAGMVVGGIYIGRGTRARLLFGDSFESEPFVFEYPSFNIRLK